MLIQINYGDVSKSDAIEAYVEDKVNHSLGHLSEKLTRVEVHLHDDNSPSKSSHNDKRCMMEARPAGQKPFVIEHSGDDLYKVIKEAAQKLSRAVKKHFDRLNTK